MLLSSWLLKHFGLNHGRWQACNLFLPAVLLSLGGLILRQTGSKGLGIFILSGLFFVFGVVILFLG